MNIINFKANKIEGEIVISNCEIKEIYSNIINNYWNKKSEINNVVETEIGIKSENQFEEGSLFAEMVVCYDNTKEIELETIKRLEKLGFKKEFDYNFLKIETPTHIYEEKHIKDIGYDYVNMIVDITITEKQIKEDLQEMLAEVN